MKKTLTTEEKLQSAVIKLSNHYDLKHVIQRALLNGIFTAAGLFLGAILVFLFASRFVAGIKEIPFVDDFLKQSKLDVVIESQLNNLGGKITDISNTSSDINYLSYSVYKNSTYNLEFSYPQIFSSFDEASLNENDTTSHLIRLSSGEIYLEQLDVYINVDVTVTGDNYQRIVKNEKFGDIELFIYENGGVIDNNKTETPILLASFTNPQSYNKFTFVAYAKENSSAIGREIITNLLLSLN